MSDILREIVAKTRAALTARKPDEALLRIAASARRSDRSFSAALRAGRAPRIIAEIKAASPSAGAILAQPDVEQIAANYARGGAAAISVVTEPDFFGGSSEWIGRAGRASGLPVLMKDFIVEPVQIYEAAVAGTDAVLLIAAILDSSTLRRLLRTATDVGLDALVEVHDEEELARAVEAGAKIIGVNNRNLRDFRVDLATAERLAAVIPAGVIRVAESGIKTRRDVERLRRAGFDAFLVGESLLRQSDHERAVRSLLAPQVKICGITRPADADVAIDAGASFVGIVFAPGSPRRVDTGRARDIASRIRNHAGIVGVFRDQPTAEVRKTVEEVGLDYVQLHGAESPAEVAASPRPVIKALPVNSSLPDPTPFAAAQWLMFDTSSPGAGHRFDWQLLKGFPREKQFFLAGGLNPQNIAEAIRTVEPDAVDISSGVEGAPGIKSEAKIRALFASIANS